MGSRVWIFFGLLIRPGSSNPNKDQFYVRLLRVAETKMKLSTAVFLSRIAGRIYQGRLEAVLRYGQVAVVLYISPAGQARHVYRGRSCCGVFTRSLKTPLFVRGNSDNQTASISTLPRIGQVVLQLQIVYLPKAAAWGGNQDNPSWCWISKVR